MALSIGPVSNWTALAAASWAVVLGAVGALATELGPWYYSLRKPPWQPPDWVFGPAWTTIFLLGAVALALAWDAPIGGGPERQRLALAYGVNALLNILWSVLFFRVRRPDWALVEVAALWLSIVAMMVALRPLLPIGPWLLAPYLLWVSFATALNLAIVRLNFSFSGR